MTHWPAESHAVGAKVGTGQVAGSVPGGQMPHGSPHAFPSQPHAGGAAQSGGMLGGRHTPSALQAPTYDGIMQGGLDMRQGGS